MKRRGLAIVSLLLCLAAPCVAYELTEIGVELDLGLEPFRGDEGQIYWWITFGVYGRVTVDDEWRLEIAAGSEVRSFNPFADLVLLRVFTPQLMLAGNLLVRSLPQRGLLTTAAIGGRYAFGDLQDARIELTSLPVGWRLTSFNNRLRGDFFVDGNLRGFVSLGRAGPGVFGEGLELSVVRAGIDDEPLIPLGGQWALSARLTTHAGNSF